MRLTWNYRSPNSLSFILKKAKTEHSKLQTDGLAIYGVLAVVGLYNEKYRLDKVMQGPAGTVILALGIEIANALARALEMRFSDLIRLAE